MILKYCKDCNWENLEAGIGVQEKKHRSKNPGLLKNKHECGLFTS